ncbi:hypothetical protein JQ628_14355 [Bradyrhizobium lablabi]|uniref:hypothetical protein n=1 Tax=Bradyrhizobium lablabi TaxID=722472 RepID=UPI001BA4BFF9|nr:hypothetical protein [Bradyrhizobium lablabi]MBR1122706.1 hypothetical protein [Bradyrhizobium lablabi]
MKQLIAAAAVILMCGPAFADNTGPAPQTGMDHPEVTKGARESGAMDTTGVNTRDSKQDMSRKDMSKGAPKRGDVKK